MLKNNMLATHGKIFHEMMFNFKEGVPFRDFFNAIERNANNSIDPLKFKGDCLEIFAEIFFNAFQNDPAIGLVDYTPIAIENDYGVDATGYNADHRKVAVQVKFRGNPQDLVLYEEIAKTDSSGRRMLGLDLDHKQSIYIFTTAIGATPSCKKVFDNSLVLINIDIIRDKVDNNSNFWNYAYKEVWDYLNS